MHFILEPKKGAKPLHFGMQRNEVRKLRITPQRDRPLWFIVTDDYGSR